MINIGTYTDDDRLQRWYLADLPEARRFLSSFPTLNALFNNFADYENKRHKLTRNAVLDDIIQYIRRKNPQIRERLRDLERLLLVFKINTTDNEKFEDFKARLVDDEYYKSFSAFTELHIAGILADRVGINNVKLFPQLSNGKHSDILVRLAKENLYFEIINLGRRESERKIEEIVTCVAGYIGKKINKCDCHLQAYIDTAELVSDDRGNIEVGTSLELLCQEADRLAIHKLAGFSGLLNIESMRRLRGLLELKPWKQNKDALDESSKQLVELMETPIVKEWLKCIDSIERHTPYTAFLGCLTTKGLLVEIHTDDIYPSTAAKAEEVAFISQIKRAIKREINKGQLESDNANIIIVQGMLWSNEFEGISQDFEKIGRALNELLAENVSPHLSGILLFSNKLDNARFVANPHADNGAKLDDVKLKVLRLRTDTWS